MLFFSRYNAAGVLALLAASCAQNQQISYETSTDPGGCLVTHIAVEPGVNQFHYDGLSPDGNKLAVGWDRDGEESGLFLLDLKTGARTDIPELNNGGVFSPDGSKLVLVVYMENGKTDIAEYDLASGEMTFIAPHDDWDWLASYSSDGELILYNSYRTGASDIYTYRKSDGTLKQWTDFHGYEAHGQFSPDDTKILFHRQEEGEDFNLYIIETQTGEISQLTNDASEESYGSWSPDGETIVFASDRDQASGKTDIYLMNPRGGDVRRITDHTEKDSYPFFSPDGKHVVFHSDREPAGMYQIEFDENLACVKSAAE